MLGIENINFLKYIYFKLIILIREVIILLILLLIDAILHKYYVKQDMDVLEKQLI